MLASLLASLLALLTEKPPAIRYVSRVVFPSVTKNLRRKLKILEPMRSASELPLREPVSDNGIKKIPTGAPRT